MTPVSTEDLRRLAQTLRSEIPLAAAMEIEAAFFDARGLCLRAPLAPNINHKLTAFGGSLANAATLAGWGLVQILVRDVGFPVIVVIQECRVQYLKPVLSDIEALALLPDAVPVEKFLRTLARHGRARLALEARIPAEGEPAVIFSGQFVATRHGW